MQSFHRCNVSLRCGIANPSLSMDQNIDRCGQSAHLRPAMSRFSPLGAGMPPFQYHTATKGSRERTHGTLPASTTQTPSDTDQQSVFYISIYSKFGSPQVATLWLLRPHPGRSSSHIVHTLQKLKSSPTGPSYCSTDNALTGNITCLF